MTHRTDLEWIDLENDFNHLKKELMKMQHSKVICCRGGLDNIEGILYLKDFFRYATGSGKKHLRDLIVKPVAIPENADAQTVLNHLRINRSHICFVLNEYGGFEGIITLHDIMENIVGQIPNEGEAYEPDIFVRDDDSILVNGDAPIETLAEIFDNFIIDFEKIDYSTVAGFVFSRMNSIPKTGDKFSFGNYEIEILDLDGNRIDKILIKKRP
jgi:putative hemolysin